MFEETPHGSVSVYLFWCIFVPVDISSAITQSLEELLNLKKRSSLATGCVIGFFVLLRLSLICVSRYLFFSSESVCDWSTTDHSFYAKERRKFGPAHSREMLHLAGLLILPPFPTSLAFPPSIHASLFPPPMDG